MRSLIVALLFLPLLALAANTGTINFTPSTQNTDGTAIDGPVTYNLYQGIKGAAKTKVGTVAATGTTINTGLANGVEYCWEVTAVARGNESARSNEACKSFPFGTPAAVTITVT